MLLILSLIKLFYNTLILFYKIIFTHLNILSSFLLDDHSKSLGFLLFANSHTFLLPSGIKAIAWRFTY